MRYLIEDSGGFLNQALRNEALNRRLFRLQEAHRHKRAHQRHWRRATHTTVTGLSTARGVRSQLTSCRSTVYWTSC